MQCPCGIAVEANGRLLVTDRSLDTDHAPSVFRVDPMTGNRRVVSGYDTDARQEVGTGPILVDLQGIAVAANHRLMVVDALYGLQGVVQVDPITGDRTLVSQGASALAVVPHAPTLRT